jgi:hypothetical protein
MQCPQCHTENKAGRKFCTTCGHALALACPACGFVNEPGDRLCGGCGQPLTAIPPPEPTQSTRTTPPEEQAATPATSSPTTPPPADAERRQLTVMFCDLVGSTALSEQLDPEDLRQIVRAYQQTCAEVIQRFDGHIAQLLGDGLLVYFGWPQAHDDDARRAVQAVLGILAAMDTLNTRQERDKELRLAVRVGIHTGLVVVGAQVIAKTDGVLLFVEELVKMVLESGLVQEEADRYVLTGPPPPLAIPATLQDSLMARLDRLTTARAVAQLGAVLGREFDYELIRGVALMDEATVQRGLAQLCDWMSAPPLSVREFHNAQAESS